MSLQDVRNTIICENLPKLIELLIANKKLDSHNANICEQFAVSRVRHHNYISVNSHEIRRRIEGLEERLRLSNYAKYADRLTALCTALINHPLCENHYEIDIQWNVLCFLLEMAQRPEAGLAKLSYTNVHVPTAAQHTVDARTTSPAQDPLLESLICNNIALDQSDSDSELSDWTGSSDDDQSQSVLHSRSTVSMSTRSILPNLPGLKPPIKAKYSVQFESDQSQNWLNLNIQSNWWKMNSIGPESCTEFRLMKEIIWMFIRPTNCTFFSINQSTLTIAVTPHVSKIESRHFLGSFVDSMSILLRLRTFCASVDATSWNNSALPPHSYECYVKAVRQCLQPFEKFLVQKDGNIVDHRLTDEPKTVLSLQRQMQPFFCLLKHLYSIHMTCVLDYKQVTPHICSAHLYAALLSEASRSSNLSYANLATAIFLVSVKAYITIIDKWWTDGFLDDWRNEFVVKNKDEHDLTLDIFEKYEIRPFTKNPGRSFYINHRTSAKIMNSVFTQMLCKHSMQAGYVLNIIFTLNKIAELKCDYGDDENLYTKFIEMVFERLQRFRTDNRTIENKIIAPVRTSSCPAQVKEYRKLFLFNENHKLALSIEESLNKPVHAKPTAFAQSDAYKLFERLDTISPLLLPIEDTILCTLTQILETQIVVANKCVLKMYKDEYQVLYHLKNLRKVYLLEASDLMYSFYSFFFKKIESGQVWNNPYILSDQLNSILCSKYPDMSSMFSVHVNTQKYVQTHVLDAINHLTINYVGNSNLQDIITSDCLEHYNQVFQFLLKVKWGLWTLENLRFSNTRKKQQPYRALNMYDYVFKRFELLRNWILYSMQCIHSHLMTHVLQTMGGLLDQRIENAKDLNEIVAVHKSYIHTIHDHCFQGQTDYPIRLGIEQLLALVIAVRDEWRVMERIDGQDDEIDDSSASQIDEIENTYINWHSYITGMLAKNVYSKNRHHLSGLAAAFSSSCPY